jgi:DNA-binding MarR family transcriptional regulator
MDQQEAGTVDLEFLVHGTQDGKKLELRLWLRMLATTRLVSHEIRRRLRIEFGATLPQFDVLAQLYRERDGLRLGELSKRTMVSNGNVTGLVERLEADGLCSRETLEADRRVTVARLTAKGEAHFTAMAAAHEGWLKDMMANVDDHTLKLTLSHMNEIKGSVTVHSAGTD